MLTSCDRAAVCLLQERLEKQAAQQQKESKAKAAERAAAAKLALQQQEADRQRLSILRANMETCRWVPGPALPLCVVTGCLPTCPA